jgi:excisionase family DNA binding protein
MGVNVSVRSRSTGGIVVQPLLLTIPQVMQCMGLGRNKVYDLINKEGLPVLRFGRAVRISRTALEQWLEQREQDSSVVY